MLFFSSTMINIPRLKQSFGHAFRGLRYAFSKHQNLRIHAFLAVLAIILGIGFQLSFVEWIAILLAILLVFVTEIINTAFEEVMNLIVSKRKAEAKWGRKNEYDGRIQVAKDVSAGMVLLAALFALVIGAIIFFPRIFR